MIPVCMLDVTATEERIWHMVMALYHLCGRIFVFHLWFGQSHIMWFTHLVLWELFILSYAGRFLSGVELIINFITIRMFCL